MDPKNIQLIGESRVRLIKGWDKLLTWTLSPKNKPFQLTEPVEEKNFQVQALELIAFNEKHGYFSSQAPIVGVVTKDSESIEQTNALLASLDLSSFNQKQFTIDEILAKVIAYRSLQKGMRVSISRNESYTVDEVIDLWRGMPAFGLVPNQKGNMPILLFRGTDLNLVSEQGWASILSDLDPNGPGRSTFLKARPEIHKWLQKANNVYGPARTVGFSLGGVLSLYTLIYEHEFINKKIPSVAFNPPGVSVEVLNLWKNLKSEQKAPLTTYVNQGDFVSQIGFFLSNGWEVSLDKQMEVIQAHVTLVSAQPKYTFRSIDIDRENQSRQ